MLVFLGGTACGTPPPPKAPERESVAFEDFAIEPVAAGTETQEKGKVVIQAVPLSMAATPRAVRRCRFAGGGGLLDNLTSKDNKHGHKDYYEVRTSKVFDSPSALTFSIKVTNRLDQVLKLDSTVVRLNADDKEVVVSNDDFKQGVLTPGQQKEYHISTDDVGRITSSATIHFGLYGMPTEMDAAGAVSKRDNFEWSFTLRKQQKTEVVEVPITVVQMSFREAEACN